MTQEQKELLMKDLCGRLPYKVYVQIPDEYGGYTSAIESIDIDGFVKDFEGAQIEIENVKPYLLPITSMTAEQKREYAYTVVISGNIATAQLAGITVQDWFNKNHIDYRGLIPMGLANDATGKNIY